MNNEFEISKASREALELYLESWGVAFYPSDHLNDVRSLAMQTFQDKGPGEGPHFVNRSSF